MAVGKPNGWVTRARGVHRSAAVVATVSGLLIAGCGGGDGGGEESSFSLGTAADSTTTDTGLPSCRDVQHVVVFDVFGTATLGDRDEVSSWASDPGADPAVRPGAADVASAYQGLGYEILYVAAHPADTQIDGQPLTDALTVWLGTNDFPIGDDARVWAPEGGDTSVALIEELARLSASGAELDAGYAGDPDGVFPFVSGGISREHVFTVGAEVDDGSSTTIPGDDLGAHLSDVQALDPVCE